MSVSLSFDIIDFLLERSERMNKNLRKKYEELKEQLEEQQIQNNDKKNWNKLSKLSSDFKKEMIKSDLLSRLQIISGVIGFDLMLDLERQEIALLLEQGIQRFQVQFLDVWNEKSFLLLLLSAYFITRGYLKFQNMIEICDDLERVRKKKI